MQTGNVTRAAIATMALMIVSAVAPRTGMAQQCRRSCEASESRDVRGCCIPKAEPAPRPARPERPPRPARAAPETEAPVASPGATRPTPAPKTSKAPQQPRTRQLPVATSPGSLRTEPPVTTRDEPNASSWPDTEHPRDTRPSKREPPGVALPPSTRAAAHEPDRRWPVWIPWATVGAGAYITGVGGWLYVDAAREFESFDEAFSESCRDGGCDDSEMQVLTEQLDRARMLEATSRISLIVGGVTLATGVALVFLNQTTEPTSERATARTFVIPTLGPDHAGISAGIAF